MNSLRTSRVERLLVRGTNWVGDAVMSIPALREIRRRFPGARISLLVKPWVSDVYHHVDFIDELILYEKEGRHRGLLGMRRLAGDLRKRRFDLAILLQNAFEAAVISYWAGIPLRLGYHRDARGLLLTHPVRLDPRVRLVHQAYYYLGILSGAGLIRERPWEDASYALDSIEIGVRDSDVAAAHEMLRAEGITPDQQVVGIHPGASYGGAKRWPARRFAEVADRLSRECGARILILGSPGEAPLARETASRMTGAATILAGRTTLGELMGIIRACRLFISNDSGPMHLAAALRVPQIAIFGSTSETATGPLSDLATVIKHEVDCSPCFLRECPIDFRCMLEVTVEDVVSAAKSRLTAASGNGGG
jgi:heptosyltransferase-2